MHALLINYLVVFTLAIKNIIISKNSRRFIKHTSIGVSKLIITCLPEHALTYTLQLLQLTKT